MSRAWAITRTALLALSGAGLAFGLSRLLAHRPIEATWSGEHYELLAPDWLYLVCATPFFVWSMAYSLADLPRAQRWLSVLSRTVLVAVLALALARVARTTDTTRVSTVFLVDVSASVTDPSIEDARAVVQAAWAARGENDVQLVAFARDAHALPIPLASAEIPAIARFSESASAGTNLQGALQLAYGLFPAGHLRRVVILSDGGETEGDLLAEASRAARFGVRLFHHPFRRGAPREVAVRALTLPERIEVGEPFHVRARIFASAPTKARVRLYQDELLNGLGGTREVDLVQGDNELEFDSVVRIAGPVTYTLQTDPQGADRFRDNNRYATSVLVPGKPQVLYVESDPGRATYLARALAAGDFEVDVRSPRELPQSLGELERFDFVVLSDVSADQVSLSQMDTLERYVRDLGGGFLMAGGEQSFGLGGWQHTRIEQLLPVRMDAERRRDQPSLAIALVIDKSGSMNGVKMELAKDAARATAELLSPEDYLGVVAYDAQPVRTVRMQSARNRLRILQDIGRLSASGGTAILPALMMAFDDLSVTRALVKHTILLTDGVTQEPSDQFSTLVQAMRAEGITVSVVGLGPDVNRSLLTSLANLGGGRAYFTNDPHNVPRIFMRETTTVQRSSAVEEYFQPSVDQRADFLHGLDLQGAPYLHGYVATRMKPAPAQQILASDLGEPILARWRVGLGWSLAWTSDVKNHWAIDWLRWPGFQPFWSQLVREHMRQRRRQTLDMHAEVQGGEVRVEVDALGSDDRFLDGLESTMTLDGPMGARGGRGDAGAAAPLHETHRLRQTAPGRYEARFPLDRFGAFVLTAQHQRDGRTIAESHTQVSNPYPREYALLEANVALLDRAASLTGGKAEPTPAELFDAHGETIERYEELWPKLLFAALGLFVVDLLLRRVRLFDRGFRVATRERRRGPS